MAEIVIDESWYQRPAGLKSRESAGGVVFRHEQGRDYLALVLEGDRHQAYILPKGHVDPGETIEIAARREIEEEAGFSELTLRGKLGVRERLNLFKTAWKTVHYFLFQTAERVGYPTDPNHDYHVEWFAVDALPPLFWPEQQEMVELACQWLRDHADLR